MKHLAASKKIELKRKASAADLRAALVESLEDSLEISSISDGDAEFTLTGTTGSPASISRYAKLDLKVSIKVDDETARILVSGYSRVAPSLTFLYLFLFIAILLVGLLPGFVETDADKSNAIDALFFLILGIFVIFDVNKKLAEPKEDLDASLEALNTLFG